MSKLLFTVLFITLIFSLQAQPAWQWARSITGTGIAEVFCVYTSLDNFIFVSGHFTGSVTIGNDVLSSAGESDAFVAKLDANGNWLWAVQCGATGNEKIVSLVADAEGNLWVAGYYNQSFALGTHLINSFGNYDIFYAKLSPQRTWLGAIGFGSADNDGLGGIALGADGAVYVAGEFTGSITIGTNLLTSAAGTVFISKWDSDLNNIWAQQLNNHNNYINCSKIGTDAQGNCYLIGDFQYTVSFGVNNPITITSLHMDAYVAKLNSAGVCLWADKAGSGSTALTDGYIDAAGSCYLTTTMVAWPTKTNNLSRLDIDVAVAKVNNVGVWQWWEATNDMAYCVSNKVTADSFYDCYLTGGLWGLQSFGSDSLVGGYANGEYNANIYLAKATPDGIWQWGLQTYSGGFSWEGAPYVTDIAAVQSGNCVIAGKYKQRGVDFGNIIIPPAQQYSVFVAMGGTEPTSGTDIITENSLPVRIYPNPTTESIKAEFDLNKAKAVSLSVYNVKGQLVKSSEPMLLGKGKHCLAWDGNTINGTKASPGVYLIRLKMDKDILTKLIIKR